MPKSILEYERMSLRQLQELMEIDLGEDEETHANGLNEVLEKKILITGQGGRGKTTAGVCLSHDLRDVCGRPVVVIGSRMGLTKEFGEFMEIDEEEFIDQLRKLSEASLKLKERDKQHTEQAEQENAEEVYKILCSHGVNIAYATLVFDEARNLFSSRKAMEKLVQVAGDFVMQARHYHVTTILLAPDDSELDKRVVRQMQWKGTCFYNDYSQMLRVHLKRGAEDLNFEWDTEDDLLHPKYHSMFNSHTVLGFRASSLNIKNV